MLQQFTPLYKHQAQTSQILETPKVTVQFPLLYRVMKDNRTHHVLGHIHPIPLEFMPDHVIQVINDSHCLLTESLASLPQELQENLISNQPFYGRYAAFFSNALKDMKERFTKDIIETMQILTGTDCQQLQIEKLSVTLISILFTMFIETRARPEKSNIDEALVQHFKNQHKSVVELNEQNKEDYSRYIESEKYLQSQLISSNPNEQAHATAFLHAFGASINTHYKQLGKHDLLQDDAIKKFLENNLANDEITCDQEAMLRAQAENKMWLDVFINEHNKGIHNIFLACGYMHLLLPQQSFLHLLTQQGFTVKRVYETQLHHQPSRHTAATC